MTADFGHLQAYCVEQVFSTVVHGETLQENITVTRTAGQSVRLQKLRFHPGARTPWVPLAARTKGINLLALYPIPVLGNHIFLMKLMKKAGAVFILEEMGSK